MTMTAGNIHKAADAPRCPTCHQCLTVEQGGLCFPCSLELMRLGLQEQPDGSTPTSHDHPFPTVESKLASEGVISKFDDYELVHELARGGMGVVYLAKQISLQRHVAIKLILAGQLASAEAVHRFRREAEAAARLQHPGIVQIFDIGEYAAQHYFSMEYIDGASLAQCMSDFSLRNPCSRSERVDREQTIAELMMKVAQALDYAHQRGVLHRDVKPSNILLDEQGQPHLTDFGLAKLADSEQTGFTTVNAVMGTPGYLAPEQVEGNLDRITITTDVYGIGATLFELLTGQPPFIGTSAMETMWKAAKEEVRAPRSLNPAISQDLETIALRCLQKKPDDRYPSAAMVAEELQRFLRHEPIQARRVSHLEYALRLARRHPRSTALLIALIFTLLFGTGISVWQWNRAERSNRALTESVENLEWNAIDAMVTQGESSRALATVAYLIRQDPNNWKASMFAMSMLEQNRFPLPAAPTIRHPSNMDLNAARLSRDGDLIVTASMDGTARLWHTSDATAAGEALQHDGPVTWAEFHPSERTVATCSKDGTVQFWDVETSRAVCPPFELNEPVHKIEYSSDGRLLLARSDHKLVVLDGSTGQVKNAPIVYEGTIVAARWIGVETKFFCAVQRGANSEVTVTDASDGTAVATVQPGDLRHADLSDNMQHLAVVNSDGSAWVADFPDLVERHMVTGSAMDLQTVRFDPTGELFCTVSHNLWSRVWSSKTALPVSDRLPHYYMIDGAAFTAGGKQLLTWGQDSLVNYWDIEHGGRACEPLRHPNRVVHAEHGAVRSQEVVLATLSHRNPFTAIQQTGSAQLWNVGPRRSMNIAPLGFDPRTFDATRFSPNGKYIIVGKTSQEVWLHDALTGQVVCGPFPVTGSPWGIQFSPDNKKLIVTTASGKISCFSLPDGRSTGEPISVPQCIQSTEASADRRLFATASTDGVVRLWDSQSLEQLHELNHGSGLNSIAFSPDANRLASAGEDQLVCVWDTSSGELVHKLVGHTNEVMKVAYSPDGRTIVTSSHDFSAGLWDARTGRLLHRLLHQGEVLDADFSFDSRLVATGSRDRTAVIWDVQSGKPTVNGLLHTQGVRNVMFHPERLELLTCSFDGLRLWDAESGNPLTVTIPQRLMAGTGFQASSTRGSYSPDGTAVVRGTDAYEALLWRYSKPTQAAPGWFTDLLESVAGRRIDANSRRPENIPSENFLEIKRSILASNETDYYTLWAKRWLK
ncbi:MAG: protein kinase [Pirellulales bacterium]